MSNLKKVIDENRLIRFAWSKFDGHGRELLCMYTAIAGDSNARPADCNGRKMPPWIAHLLPFWDNSSSAEEWPRMVRRVALLESKLEKIAADRELSERLDYGCRAIALRVALPHDRFGVVQPMLNLCELVAAGTPRAALTRKFMAAAKIADMTARGVDWEESGAADTALAAAEAIAPEATYLVMRAAIDAAIFTGLTKPLISDKWLIISDKIIDGMLTLIENV